jgi:hypothetical protein
MSKKQQQKPQKAPAKSKPAAKPKLEQKFVVPAAMGSILTVGAPQINGGKGVTVRHTEYLDDISGLLAFAVNPAIQVYALNPGLITSFPWLGNMAAGYEQYRWKRLSFRYRARCGTGTNGTVYFSTQLDSNDPDFASKEEMYAYAGTKSTMPWLDMTHDCLLGRADYMKKYFIRTGDLASDEDSQLYDTGKFTFVPITTVAGFFMGELLVDYEVELYNPKMNVSDVGAGIELRTSPTGTPTTPFAGIQTIVEWGASEFAKYTGNNSIQFQQPGLYQIALDFFQSSGVFTGLTVTQNGDIGVNGDTVVVTPLAMTYHTWVLVGLAGAALVFATTGGTTFIGSLVKLSSTPLALASLLGTFTVSEPLTAESMKRRFKKRNIRFATKQVGDRKENRARSELRSRSSERLPDPEW